MSPSLLMRFTMLQRILLLLVMAAILPRRSGAAAPSYARHLPGVERTVIIATAPDNTWVGRGRLAIRRKEWLFAYVAGNHHGGVDTTKRIHLRFSTDEGRTWTAADTLPSGGKVRGFPVGPGEEG